MDEGWEPLNIGEAEILEEGEDILIIAYGSMVASAIETAKILKNMKINACIVNARFVKPLDKNLIMPLNRQFHWPDDAGASQCRCCRGSGGRRG